MSLFSLLKSIVGHSDGVFRAKGGAQVEGALQFATNFNTQPGIGLIAGGSASGKTMFISEVCKNLTGCVVHLALADSDLPGWSEAPFHGLFTSSVTKKPCAKELSSIFNDRPSGYFSLEFSSNALRGNSPTAQAIQEELCEMLLCALTLFPDAPAPSRRVTLVVDDCKHLLTTKAREVLLRYGKASNIHVILVEQNLELLGDEYVLNVNHLASFRHAGGNLQRFEKALGIPLEGLAQLELGEFWYKSSDVNKPSLLKFNINC